MQQRLEPGTRFRCQTIPDAGIEPIIMRADRGADDSVDAIERRRFNQKLTAPGLNKSCQLIGMRTRSGHLIAEPGFQHLGIGNGCFPEP